MAKNCIFYDKSFLDDMYSYRYDSTEDRITYDEDHENSEVYIKNTINFIGQKIYKGDNNIWYPVFITSDTSQINDMPLYKGTTTLSNNIGLQNAIEIFNPKFNNWEIDQVTGDAYMSTDWILTPDLCPFYPEYGLMFWFKYDPILNQPLAIDNIPIGSSAYITLGPESIKINDIEVVIKDKILIKQDLNTFLISDIDAIKQNQNEFLPSNEYRYITINDIINNTEYKREDIKFLIKNSDPIIVDSPTLSLWIPDGDTYTYFKSPQMRNEAYFSGSSSSSYISPALSHIYREVYDTLSAGLNTRKITNIEGNLIPEPNFKPNQSKHFKRLCHVLSTHPLVDRTTVSLLRTPYITSLIKQYIDTLPRSINEEIRSLKNILNLVSKQFIDLSNSRHTNTQDTYSHGLVTTKKDLFNKLISKYGSKLVIDPESNIKIKYKNGLKNGPHVKINQEITSKCSKVLENQSVYNNIKISAGSFNIKTQFSNNETKLILENTQKKNEKIIIPLWDIEKTKFKNIRIPVTAGPDIRIDFGKQQIDTLKEIEYFFTGSAIDYNGKYDTTIIGSEEPDILWKKISGPDCIRFGKVGQPSMRYETSIDASPTVYIKSPGRYVLEVRVRTSFGIIYDTVTIHAIGEIKGKDDQNKDIVIKTYSLKERLRPASVQYIQAKNNLSIMVPNIRECYIGKQGVFWPSYTDCSVKVPQGLANPDAPPGPGNSLPPVVLPLGNNYHKFAMPMTYVNNPKYSYRKNIQNGPVDFDINYQSHNTKIELNRIILTNLSSHETSASKEYDLTNRVGRDLSVYDPDSNGCESIYEGVLDNRGFILDGGSENASFSFIDPSNNNQIVTVNGLDSLQTKRFATKTYGGFSKAQVDKLGIKIPFHPSVNNYLTPIRTTGNFLSAPKSETDGKITQLCHDTELPVNCSVEFTKGCFHPFHGWTDRSSTNLSSVVNFDPYNRAVQVFKGPGFYDLNNSFEDGKPKIYKSSITLSVHPEAYDPVDEEAKNPEIIDKKEITDHIDNYGYRSIGGIVDLKMLNYNDEFAVDFPIVDDAPVSSENYCLDATLEEYNYGSSYVFTRPGAFIPFKDRKTEKRLRWKRYGGTNISNIEVKLNFLNYVNPKNLVVWLEIDTCAFVAESLNPPAPDDGGVAPPPKDPWFKGSYYDTYQNFSLLSGDTKKYLSSLWNMNDNIPLSNSEKLIDFSGSPKVPRNSTYRIYLLNQDHIANYEYNASLKFSDLLDLINNPHSNNNNADTYNSNLSTLYIDNNISNKINNTIDLAPTLSAAGYDDNQVASYKKIITENKLLNNSHRFQKISSMPIFSQSKSAKRKAGNSSETTFKLCIAVMDESDPFEPYDRILATQELIGYNTCTTRNRSNLVENSLCNWELIIHRIDESNGFIPGDSLGNIKYEDNNPNIPGYSFIADLTDMLHLLPPAVINAPNSYTIDGRLCRYSKESLNVPKFSQPLPFVIFPLILMLPTSILGALAAMPGIEMAMNEQTRQIANYLHSLRKDRQRDIFNRAWYVANYDKYPMGSSDKILISASKDNELFYKTEASIFRYSNSIVMQKHDYKFYKLHYNSYLRHLSIFKINLIDDNNFIKTIYNNYLRSADKDYVGPSDIYQDKIDNTNRKNIRISNYALGIDAFKDLFYSDLYVKHNNIFDLSKNPDGFDKLLEEKRLYAIDGLRAYYFFENNKTIVELAPKETKDINNEKIKELKDRLAQLQEAKKTDYEQYDEDEVKNIENEIFLMSYNIIPNTIQNIGYIFNNVTYKTIIILQNKPQGNIISIDPANSNRIIMLDNDKITISENETVPLDIWSFNDYNSHSIDTAENIKESAWGVSNYGYGSNLTTRYMLSQPDINSKIIPLIDRIHYAKNSTVDYNSFASQLTLSKNTIPASGTTKGNAFVYTLDNMNGDRKRYGNVYSDDSLKKYVQPVISGINYSVYENQSNYGYMTEIDVSFNYDTQSYDKGTISFNKDINPIEIMKLDKDSKISDLIDRDIQLNGIIKTKLDELKNLSKIYSSGTTEQFPVSEKETATNQLQMLYIEKGGIQYYLNKLASSGNISTIPHISVTLTKNDDGSLIITEKKNDNFYWINIDPEQGCSIDKDRTPKILKTVKYTCLQYDDIISSNASSICPDATATNIIDGADESFRNIGIDHIYELSDKLIEETKLKYPNLKWPEDNTINHVVERTFFLNFHGSERAQGITAIYSYICPLGPAVPEVEPDGNITNKVYNIFNLDKTTKLYVDFKRIPRLLRNKDPQFDMYEPNDFGELSKSIYPAPGGPIDGSFRVWKCIDAKTGEYVVPYNPYYIWLNEMLFRTYFGSVDGIEYQGRETVQSKDEGYWIPYDFSY